MTWWRCVWLKGELVSVEKVDPPPGARDDKCFDVPNGHGCCLKAETLDDALGRTREYHPSMRGSS